MAAELSLHAGTYNATTLFHVVIRVVPRFIRKCSNLFSAFVWRPHAVANKIHESLSARSTLYPVD